jgi:hypothetical protein
MAGPTSRVSRVLMTGPLAPFADVYREELRDRGYTVRSTVCELRQVARLSCWLAARGLTAADLSAARVDEFMVWQRARALPLALVASRADVSARRAARSRGAGDGGAGDAELADRCAAGGL